MLTMPGTVCSPRNMLFHLIPMGEMLMFFSILQREQREVKRLVQGHAIGIRAGIQMGRI